ncbi:tRNA (guanine-N(7)-)-methyltransferase (tRNA(m7G46)-methyltransferase), partial [Coemansia biformis]
MYAAVAAAARVLLGYILVGPLVIGAAIALLLVANVLVSYWFQRERKPPGFAPRQRKPLLLLVDPPVARIPQLGFAKLVNTAQFQAASAPALSLERYPQLAAELCSLLQLVVRDFVHSWFADLSTDASFPSVVLAQAVLAVEAVAERCRRVDTAELAVGQLVPLITSHVRHAKEPVAALHPAIRDLGDGGDERAAVLAHVRRVVDLLLPLVLPPEQLMFGPHRVLVRELLSGALLMPLLLTAADPDTANQLVDSQLERLIREQHMVDELRDALDQQSSTIMDLGGDNGDGEAGYMDDDGGGVRTYEQFMSTIDQCQDLRDLEKTIDDIVAQIRKRRILIMGQNKDDIVHGQRVRDILVYINRLYVAKKKAERRAELLRQDSRLRSGASAAPVSASAPPMPRPLGRPASAAGVEARPRRGLGAHAAMSRASTYYEHRDDPARLGPPQFTLREILTNVSSLSAFTEYMDLAGKRTVLEFWVNVEGVRQISAASTMLSSVVASLWKNYFTLRVDELAEAGGAVADGITRVQRFLKPHRAGGALDLQVSGLSEDQSRQAFELICAVQESVFCHMEEHSMPAFQRNALYSRFLREYYVTSRKDHMDAALFARTLTPLAEEPLAEALAASTTVGEGGAADSGCGDSSSAAPSVRARSVSATEAQRGGVVRRPSVARSEAGSVAHSEPAKRASRWSFALRHRDAPVVGTDTAQAVAVPRASVSSIAADVSLEPTPAPNAPLEPEEPWPAAPVPRRPVRVGRSELRRLSASLRSIAVADEPAASMAATASPSSGDGHALAAEDGLQEGALSGADSDEVSGSSGDEGSPEDSGDEAESLVLARVVKTPAPGDLFLDERLQQLAQDVERKVHQMAIVRALMRQAGTRHRAHEQRVLQASHRGLRREVRAAMEQQRLYEAVLEDHQLAPARTRIHIPRTILSGGDDGDEHLV